MYAGSIPTPASIFFRPDGEIGRHKRLKISRSQERAGSIPAPGTKQLSAIYQFLIKGCSKTIWHAFTAKLFAISDTDLALSGISSVGRAGPCQGSGRRFEPDIPLQHFGVVWRDDRVVM